MPAIGLEEDDAHRCAMKPLYVFAEPKVALRGAMRPYLDRVGLGNVSSRAIAGVQEPFASHSSVVATLDGARLLLRPPRGTHSVFGAVEPKLASKVLAEALAGVIVNRISLIASNGAAMGCAASSIPWKGSRVGGYTEDAQPRYLKAAIGYRKVHCSDWMRMHASDVTFTAMLRFADENQDGLMSRRELALSITERPAAWAYALRATCLSFPFGRDMSLRRFIERGPAWPGVGEPVVSIMRSARFRHQREWAISSPCMFWAEEALALLFVLPTSTAQLQAQIEQAAEPLIGTLTRKLSGKDRFWRPLEYPRRNGSHTESRSNHDGQALGRELAEALFAMSDTDGDGLVSFDDLKVAVSKPSSTSSILVPACWRAGGWFGALLSERSTGPGLAARKNNGPKLIPRRASLLAAGIPQLAPDQLAAVDFEARLRNLQTFGRAKMYHSWQSSNGLAQSLSAGSLLYARAALCCERCAGSQERRCSSFDSGELVPCSLKGHVQACPVCGEGDLSSWRQDALRASGCGAST